MKYFITASAIALAGAAYADDDSFNGVSGAFGGNVSTFAKSGGASMTGSWGGDTNTSIRNESGSDEFAGQAMDALMNTVEEDDQVAASQDLPTVCRAFSKQAYEIADAMLKQREGE